VICKGNKGNCEWEAYCAKIQDEETWQQVNITIVGSIRLG